MLLHNFLAPRISCHVYLGISSSEASGIVSRSVSAPHLQQPGSEQLVQGLEDLQRFRRWDQTLRHLRMTSYDSLNERRECPDSVVEQIFTFVAGNPDQTVRNFLFYCFEKLYAVLKRRVLFNIVLLN